MAATPENIVTCLTPIIGLSESTCNCVTTGKPSDAGNSQSGYFITDQRDGMPVQFINAITDCDTGGIWTLLAKARADAAKNMVADIHAEFGQAYTARYPDFTGYLGQIEDSTAISNGLPRAVVQLKSRQVPATLKIKGLKMYSNVTASVVVSVYDRDNLTTALGSVTVSCVAGSWVAATFSTAVTIDLYDENESEGHKYFVSWTIPNGGYARANKADCGCGGRKKDYANFIEVNGYTVTALADMNTGATTSHGDSMMGISLDISIGCTLGNFLCGLSFDTFNANGLNWVIAKTMQHGSVSNLADAFIKSQRINQYTLLSQEAVYGIRAHAEKAYLGGIKYIVQNMPEGATQCFDCRDARYNVRSIMV